MLLRIKQYVISSKLSETTLDSRSTLVIEKLKAIKLDESIRQEKMTKKKQNKNIKHDEIGNKKGKLYVDRQDLKRVNTKKRKMIRKDRNNATNPEKLVEKTEN